jgi:hypothetical protein
MAALANIVPESTALATIETMTAADLFSPGKSASILERIKAEVRADIRADISTEKGRKAVASLAYKVSRTKTFIDEQRLALVAGEKKRLALIDAEGRVFREELDALRDEVRQPLTEWENAEKERIAEHETALLEISACSSFSSEATVQEIDERLAYVDSLSQRKYQEFTKRATEAIAAARESLTTQRDTTVQREVERAKLERLRLEEEVRKQREHEEAIAARAKAEAEAATQRKAEAKERAAIAERERIERESRESLERERRRAQEAEDAAIRAEQRRLADAERAKLEAAQAILRANEAQELAIQRERERVGAEHQAEIAAAAKREANRKHRARVNTAAAHAFVAEGMTEEYARLAVEAIAKNLIPAVQIAY